MVENFKRATELLAKVNPASIEIPEEQMHYYYLEGMVGVLTNQPTEKVMFSFTHILDELDERRLTIYSQLAYLGKGILYVRKENLTQAAFFFDKVTTYLNEQLGNPGLKGSHYFQTLTLLYYLAEYHSLVKELKVSNDLIGMALDICSVKHVTYFLPRLKLLQAKNLLEQVTPHDKIRACLNDALAFARLNRNQTVQVQILALQQQLK